MGGDHLQDLGVNGKTILELIWRNMEGRCRQESFGSG
jgi:hypothetical protein